MPGHFVEFILISSIRCFLTCSKNIWSEFYSIFLRKTILSKVLLRIKVRFTVVKFCTQTLLFLNSLDKNIRLFGPRQANLVLIAYASSEGSGEPAHPRSLARTSAARSYKQWVKKNLQTESQIWMAGHAQLKFTMTECSKTQIRLTRPIWEIIVILYTVVKPSVNTKIHCHLDALFV